MWWLPIIAGVAAVVLLPLLAYNAGLVVRRNEQEEQRFWERLDRKETTSRFRTHTTGAGAGLWGRRRPKSL